MIILCTHNDGGVGKTTLAVHATGVLTSQSGRTLLIDCDDQSDSWQFYAGRIPNFAKELLIIEDNLSIIENQKREKIASLVDIGEYDNIVIDIDSPLRNTVQTIIQNDPEIVLVPINKAGRPKALRNLPRTLSVIAKLESKSGYSPEVIIVPLGVEQNAISEVVEKIQTKPQVCRVAPPMRNLQEEMACAVYEERKHIWNYEGCEDLYDYFCSLLGI